LAEKQWRHLGWEGAGWPTPLVIGGPPSARVWASFGPLYSS